MLEPRAFRPGQPAALLLAPVLLSVAGLVPGAVGQTPSAAGSDSQAPAGAPAATTPGDREAAAHPGLWSQWRGPARDGLAPAEPAWPASFGKSLKRVWRVGDLGPSYSGPVVDADRVYTTATEDEEFEVVTAYDRDTGEPVWSTRWKGSMSVPFFAARNGSWIRATPALADGRLYVAGMRDVLVCLDAADGKELWRVDFVERFGTPLPQFGFVCSPLVRDGAVYVQAGASFVKLDAATGETVWRTLEDEGGMMGSAFSSPTFGRVGGKEQILVQTRAVLAGVDDAGGEVLWQQPIRSFRGMAILTPTPWDGGVFTSAYGGRAHLFRPQEVDGEMEVVETWSGRAQGNMTSPVVVDGHAYLYLRSKRMTCVDLATGESTWISEPLGDEYWSLVAQGDRILALTNAGELAVVAADPEEFRMLESMEVSPSQTWAHLAVDGRQLLIREQDGLSVWAWE